MQTGEFTMIRRMKNEEFEAVYRIMERSFPPDERRTGDEQEALLKKPNYRIYVHGDGESDDILAFAAVWLFEDFVFLEHLAVSPEHRNGGLGAEILRELHKWAGRMICLEVEPPETELAARRIAFYQRCGLFLNHYPYIQPPISRGRNPVPLLIMTSGRAIEQQEFESLRALLYRDVYEQEME